MRLLILATTMLFFLLTALVKAQEVPPEYFGLHMNSAIALQPPSSWGQPWPAVPFGTMRLWDAGVFWSHISTGPGQYNWKLLDEWLNDAQEFGVKDLMYTFGKTPQWAASNPNDLTCTPNWNPGECDPPKDLNPDGSGTDQLWKDFVAAIATHASGRIRYWELWNEPSMIQHWNGTVAQLVRMAKDARTVILSIDSNAVLLTPPTRGAYMKSYFAAGGAAYADVITYHGYIQRQGCAIATDEVTLINRITQIMSTYGQSSKPLWNTESGWGITAGSCFSGNPSLQSAFVAQMYLLQWSAGVQRFYWYMYNNSLQGTLWQPNPSNPSGSGTLLPPGIAYGQLYNWMVGAIMTSPCALTPQSTWTCGLSRSGGYEAEAIWSASGSQTVAVPSQFVQYRDLAGEVHAIPSNGLVQITATPILLETGPASALSAFSVSILPHFQTIRSGSAATYVVTVSSANQPLKQPVVLSCASIPSGSTCNIAPAILQPGFNKAAATVTVATSANLSGTASVKPSRSTYFAALFVLPIGFVMASGFRPALTTCARMRRYILSLVLLLCGLLLGCGASPTSTAGNPGQTTIQNQASSYLISVTGASGPVRHSVTAALNVL